MREREEVDEAEALFWREARGEGEIGLGGGSAAPTQRLVCTSIPGVCLPNADGVEVRKADASEVESQHVHWHPKRDRSLRLHRRAGIGDVGGKLPQLVVVGSRNRQLDFNFVAVVAIQSPAALCNTLGHEGRKRTTSRNRKGEESITHRCAQREDCARFS